MKEHALILLMKEDMKPALGVTEPGAIAFAVSKAYTYLGGNPEQIFVKLNSGMYKNAFTCGIPDSEEYGAAFAAALGCVAGNPELGLEALAGATKADQETARKLVKDGKVRILMSEITSAIHIEAEVVTEMGSCIVTIQDSHTNIVKICKNGQVIFEKPANLSPQKEEVPKNNNVTGNETDKNEALCEIHKYSLEELYRFVTEIPIEEIQFIQRAWEMNLKLFEIGLASPRTEILHALYKANGEQVLSKDVLATAQLLSSGAIEARVLGMNYPAMSITGSGSHGIIATLPLYAMAKIRGYTEERLLRATALSFLITHYIKEYSGKLSAFCGCGIAAGTGMACGAVYLQGGSLLQVGMVIDNMACGITGMICDGGNHGCAIKSMTAVDAAFRGASLALQNICISNIHGICGKSQEETMQNMGRIAVPGMTETERVIVDIFTEKESQSSDTARM